MNFYEAATARLEKLDKNVVFHVKGLFHDKKLASRLKLKYLRCA